MGNTNISIRIDEDLKNDFQEVCSEMGMDMTTAITVFMKQTSRERRIPFSITLNSVSNSDSLEKLKQVIINSSK